MPTFDEELDGLGSGSGSSFDDELAALGDSAPEPVKDMGSTPGGMQFSASPTEVAQWNAGAPRAGTTEAIDMDFSASPMAVPQNGGLEGVYDRMFNGNAQREMDKISEGVGRSGVTFKPGSTSDMAKQVIPYAAGPVVGGALSGGMSGWENSPERDFGARALDAGEGALYGAATGGAARALGAGSKYFGKAAQWAGDKIGAFGNDPRIQKAAQWAGAASGGSAGTALGSGLPFPGAAAAGGFAGTAAGGYLAPKVIPALGSAVSGAGKGAQALGSPAMQAFGSVVAADQIGGNLDRGHESTSSVATDAGRGNLLGDAALEALQTNPRALGSYAGEFAKAAASPEVGAVNTLITKLAQKDPAFRAGPMVELQRMTAEY